MRAVKSVLVAAGNMKIKYPKEDENIVVLRSIINVNLPKFLAHDIELFKGIILDLFPGVRLPQIDYTLMEDAIKTVCQQRNLQLVPSFLEKIIQLYDMMLVRHGYMLVGEAFSGKTCCYRILADALTLLATKSEDYTRVQYKVINPKSITMGQLYGEFDPVTHEWSDGVVATTFRNYASSTNTDRKWVVFDGPVDAVWIENMNTVLDDNKKLCLMSGEIIQLSNSMSLQFEVRDLAVASPATVSRCGMVFMEPERLGWQPFFESWVNTLTFLRFPEIDAVRALFDKYVAMCLSFVRKNCREISPSTDSSLVWSLIQLMDSQLDQFKKYMPEEHRFAMLNVIFSHSLVWSIGGLLDSPSQVKFETFLLGVNPHLPQGKGIYDVIYGEPGEWIYWTKMVDSETTIPLNADFADIIIPTKETISISYFIETLVTHNKPMLLVGNTGTGKSNYISKKLLKGLPTDYLPIFINFSARTSANQTQNIIMARLEKRKKGMYGAKLGKKMIIFVDDLNMPALEVYGAQPPIELLRQWMDHGHWYDLTDTSKIELVDIQFIAAMGPPGGGKNQVTSRFMRHFNQIGVNSFSNTTLKKIYTKILEWHLNSCSFNEDIMAISHDLIDATLSVYSWALSHLLPTPAKSHYTFNLRDFSKIVQGLTLSNPNTFNTKLSFVKLWIHEVLRVFYDRLVSVEDQNDLLFEINSTLDSKFPELSNTYVEKGAKLDSLMFSDFDDGVYAQIEFSTELNERMMQKLEEYNNLNKNKMDLVLFRFAIQHVARISRIIRLPSGNALLVGVGGSGRQSLTRLSAFICQIELFQIEITKSYSKVEWREDLKNLLRQSGCDKKNTVFLFSDTQIKDESFVEDLGNLLNTGEVPNIFTAEEKQAIVDRISASGDCAVEESAVSMYNFFVQQVKKNLHLVICMSPIGDYFRNRIRQFSSLVNCCTIDWYHAWPEEALSAVAKNSLQTVDLEPDLRKNIAFMFQYFHQSTASYSQKFKLALGRYNYVTPTSYLELLSAYRSILGLQRNQVLTVRNRYATGLDKLRMAAEAVSQMQKQLGELQPQLMKTSQETTHMLIKIEKESKEVQARKEVVAADEAVAAKKAEQSTAMKNECEADLAEALPLLNAALSALDTLKKTDIDLVKAMKNPPDGVKLVMEAVCVMKDIKPDKVPDPAGTGKMLIDYWKASLKMLGDPHFLESLRLYDKDNISTSIIKKIRQNYIPNPEFKPEKVRNASSAAEGLCSWVIAMEAYDRVIKVVAPKQAALREAEAELEIQMKSLNEKRAVLEEVLNSLRRLQDDLKLHQEEKERLENEVRNCENKLDRARKLLDGLGGERQRWTEKVATLNETYTFLTGDVMLSSGLIAYLGAFTKTYRNEIINEWLQKAKELKIPCSLTFSLRQTLGDPIIIRNWNISGLPSDNFSIDNGVIVQYSRRWPLIIDPQGQANMWIKNMEKDNNLQVIKLSNSDYLRTLENAVQFGAPVLIENVKEELDPILEPLLQKQTFKSAGVECIKLGDSIIEYSKDFRLYITTKLRNPHYLPELQTKVSLLNFMITPEGLEDQLLGIVVQKERPELEEEKNSLILQSAENNKRLKELEDKILEILSTAGGNFLDNSTAIEVLSSSKTLSNEIIEKQKIANETEFKIDETRDSYRPIAYHSASLFFCLSELVSIDPMYQYSLSWYIQLYTSAIRESEIADTIQNRLNHIEEYFTYSFYKNVCRSLFEKDKLLFSFLTCVTILLSRHQADPNELSFLYITGTFFENPQRKPDFKWLSDKSWNDICRLSKLKNFAGLADGFGPEWKELNDCIDLLGYNFPGKWQNLHYVSKLCILKCIRPEKIILCIEYFVRDQMGTRFVEPPPFDLPGSFEESDNITPLIFILSPGVDPMLSLINFGESKGFTGGKLSSISLGQGQGPIAAKMIKEAQKTGGWVVLQNCHLAVSWMTTLEKIAEDMSSVNPHANFRLWLTSYPSAKFPSSILQNGVKITKEPPRGLKANLLRSYLCDPISNPEFYNSCPNASWGNLAYSLCFFHALVQERRNFGPLGWNIPYEFNESDLRISVRQLHMFLCENEKVPYDAINYLTGECNYGGRVTDDWDRRALMNILSKFYTPQVMDHNYECCALKEYKYPSSSEHSTVIEHIQQLPFTESPQVFGIHENGDITRQLSATKQFFDAILKTQEKIIGSGEKTVEESVLEISGDILKKLPNLFDIDLTSQRYPVQYKESMNTVLVQEMIRYNRLLSVVLDSLRNVQKAIKGFILMSPDLEETVKSLLVSKIPKLWVAKSYSSLKPLGGYIKDFIERLRFFQDWNDQGPPIVFWLSGFFFTQSFLTATLQNYARKHMLPIDELCLDYQIMQNGHPNVQDGVYVTGIFLEGAQIDSSGILVESQDKELFSLLPIMWFKPIKISDLLLDSVYECPLYKTSARRGILSTTGHSTNYVTLLRLPTQLPPKHWILRGCAGLLSLDD